MPLRNQFNSEAEWLNHLRLYFAAKAMHSELMTAGVPGDACNALVHEAERNGREVEAQIACNAYQLADAMLAAREVQS